MKVRVSLSDGTYTFLDPINDAQLALTAKRKREKTLEAKAAGIEGPAGHREANPADRSKR